MACTTIFFTTNCLRRKQILKKDCKIHNFRTTEKIFFTYFWGSTKFLIQWWRHYDSKGGGGGSPLASFGQACLLELAIASFACKLNILTMTLGQAFSWSTKRIFFLIFSSGCDNFLCDLKEERKI